MNTKSKTPLYVEPVQPKAVIVTPITEQGGIVDDLMATLLLKAKQWRNQRELEDVRGEIQVELLRLQGLAMLAHQQLEMEQKLLKRKDELDTERVKAQIIGKLKALCEAFEEIEDILNATQLQDPEFKVALLRAKRRIIEEILNKMGCK